jgi:hypothetical protein
MIGGLSQPHDMHIQGGPAFDMLKQDLELMGTGVQLCGLRGKGVVVYDYM